MAKQASAVEEFIWKGWEGGQEGTKSLREVFL